MADPQVNFFRSTLVGTYSDSDTSITIATGDGALLPDPSTDGAFNLTIFEGVQVDGNTTFEIVRVTARSGDVLTVTRGAESTTPLTIGSATHSILMSATKKTFDDINTAIQNIDITTIAGAESITFDSTGDEEFGLPAGTTAQRPSSPSAGYMRFNTDTKKLEIHTGGVWGLVSLENVRVMQTAQLSVTANDAVAENILEVEYLVIAGGGGGGKSGPDGSGGGGGAGGYRSSVSGESSGGGASSESVFEADLSTSYTVTVGAGGAGSTTSEQAGANGNDSVFNTITSTAGGRGGGHNNSSLPAGDGGSGGGGGSDGGSARTGGSGTANQGFDGGDGVFDATNNHAGGGGGAGALGGNADSSTGGNGGAGVSSSITGSSVGRAGGGGGAGESSGTGGTASDGGGAGGGTDTNGSNATTNTGSGGGGAGGDGNGGSGGSGVVILRYPSSFSITIGAGLTGSETTVGANKVATITAGTGNVSWS